MAEMKHINGNLRISKQMTNLWFWLIGSSVFSAEPLEMQLSHLMTFCLELESLLPTNPPTKDTGMYHQVSQEIPTHNKIPNQPGNMVIFFILSQSTSEDNILLMVLG